MRYWCKNKKHKQLVETPSQEQQGSVGEVAHRRSERNTWATGSARIGMSSVRVIGELHNSRRWQKTAHQWGRRLFYRKWSCPRSNGVVWSKYWWESPILFSETCAEKGSGVSVGSQHAAGERQAEYHDGVHDTHKSQSRFFAIENYASMNIKLQSVQDSPDPGINWNPGQELPKLFSNLDQEIHTWWGRPSLAPLFQSQRFMAL